MSKAKQAVCVTMVVAALSVYSNASRAGGLMIYEAGQEGTGLANAGAAALAGDPSVLMNNPAGLSQLAGTQVNLNGQVLLGHITFSRDADNDFSGNEGGNSLQYLPGSSLFISHQLDERSSIGFGMYGTFGLALDYDDDWAGRYFTQEAAILGVSFQPTYAYKITDDLAVGIGPRFLLGYYRTEVAINNNVLGLVDRPDGQLEYKDTDLGTGVNLGIFYRVNERTQVGLAYTSKVDLEFEDSPRISDVSNPLLNLALNRANIDSLQVDMEVPQTALLSVAYDLDRQWKLLSSVGWQQWSQFGKIGVEVDTDNAGTSISADRQYKDTWHLSAGGQYQASRQLRWSLGLAYDSSMVDDQDRTADNPAGASWRFATGVNYQLEEGLDLHLAYTLIWLGDLDDQQTKSRSGDSLSGTYENTAIHAIGGGATWRF